MILSEIFDLVGLEKEIQDGYISKRKHPTLPYFILNYITKTQIEWRWNIYTINCRGLIVDDQWNIIARPFKKFFTLDQWATLRNYVHNLYGVKYKEMFDGPYQITRKMDGSLNILFYNPQTNKYEMASRGAFESDQAIRGTKILQDKYPNLKVDHKRYTFLFEVIYPENKIVVDYHNMEDLILLAVIDNKTGKEISLYGGESVDFWNSQNIPLNLQLANYYNKYVFNDWHHLDKLNLKNEKGFVVRFLDNDIRVKIKFEEYKSLAKILKSLDEFTVLDWVKNNYDFGQVLNKLSQEQQDWCLKLIKQYQDDYKGIEEECRKIINFDGKLSRKLFAQRYASIYFSSVLFCMLDKKDYDSAIWKLIERRIKNDSC